MSDMLDTSPGSQETWERLGPIACGGTVSGLAISPVLRVLGYLVSPSPNVPLYWAATSCGTFRSYTSGLHWEQHLANLTTPLLSTVSVTINGYLFAGAVDGSLFYSDDFGLTWEPGKVPENLKAPVLDIAASPNFRQDRAAFAATAGAGVLVTRDAGKSWESSSSGLASSSVYALAVSGDWSHQEPILAATEQGVYVSLDGGCAWRETGLMQSGDAVGALAMSPAYASDHTVYAGTDGGTLYRSVDGGLTWQSVVGVPGEGAVSALWLAPDYAKSGRVILARDADMYLSSDRGESWRLAAQLPDSVLVFAGDERSVLAGLYDAGVWESRDGGLSWASATGDLSARSFAWLKCSSSRLYASGPQEGIWVSDNCGEDWECLSGLAPFLPLTAVSTTHPRVLLAANSGGDIVRSGDGGENWQGAAQAPGTQALCLVPETGDGWAGTVEGRLLVTHDEGATWQDGRMPCQGQEILSIVASPRYAHDQTLFMATAAPASAAAMAHITVWRSADGGETWNQVTSQDTSARWVKIVMPPDDQDTGLSQTMLTVGPYVLTPPAEGEGDWGGTIVDPSGANVLSVVCSDRADQERNLFASTATGIFCSFDSGRTWESFADGMASQTLIMSLAVLDCDEKHFLYALGLGGVIWRRELRA